MYPRNLSWRETAKFTANYDSASILDLSYQGYPRAGLATSVSLPRTEKSKKKEGNSLRAACVAKRHEP